MSRIVGALVHNRLVESWCELPWESWYARRAFSVVWLQRWGFYVEPHR